MAYFNEQALAAHEAWLHKMQALSYKLLSLGHRS